MSYPKPSCENPSVITHKELREHPLWKGSLEQQDFDMGMLLYSELKEYIRRRKTPDDLTADELSLIRELSIALANTDEYRLKESDYE